MQVGGDQKLCRALPSVEIVDGHGGYSSVKYG